MTARPAYVIKTLAEDHVTTTHLRHKTRTGGTMQKRLRLADIGLRDVQQYASTTC
jgi:hypothetical protein